LISRYDPASGFHVGNAMARNKDIYALSDAALVVATAKGTGGTWAGAVESLKKSIAPVFVKLEDPVPDGNLALLTEGAEASPIVPGVRSESGSGPCSLTTRPVIRLFSRPCSNAGLPLHGCRFAFAVAK
jgi:hypothetical protein